MKRFGLVLALLVLFGTLTVGVGTVSAFTSDDVSKFYEIQRGGKLNGGGGEKLYISYVADEEAVRLRWYDNGYHSFSWVVVGYNETFTSPIVRVQLRAEYYNLENHKGTPKVGFGLIIHTNDDNVYKVQYTNNGDIHYGSVIVNSSFDFSQYRWYVLDAVKALEDAGVTGYNYSDIKSVQVFFTLGGDWCNDYLFVRAIEVAKNNVKFHLTDGLTGQPLTGVTVKEGSNVLGTIDDGQSLELTKGTHTLTFEKQGYWSETVTVDVQQDMSVSVQLYPDTAAFRISAPASITTFENTITEVTFTISPIKTDAAYNAYLSLGGLSDIIEVKEGSNTLSPEAGKYYLGDISGETQITVKFRPSGQGTRAFTFTITSQDVLGTKTYTTTKQVKYKVDPLPFQVQLPSTWTVGDNTVRINEASGQEVLITLSLIDSQGNEVWTDSYSFGPYEGHSFTVSIPAEGTYTLKASWAGYTATWTVEVNPAISLVTDTITVKEGEIGTVQVHIENPTSNTQYYTIELTGGFVEGNVTKQVAVAPHSEKTVELAFSVPRGLDFDAYDLTLKVLQGSAVQYQGTVHVIIDGSGGLSLPLAGGSSNTLLLLGAAGAGLALVGLAVSRKRG